MNKYERLLRLYKAKYKSQIVDNVYSINVSFQNGFEFYITRPISAHEQSLPFNNPLIETLNNHYYKVAYEKEKEYKATCFLESLTRQQKKLLSRHTDWLNM